MRAIEITLIVHARGMIVEYEGKQHKARLMYQADGLDIYVCSEDKEKHPECLSNMAQNCCIARHIPLSSLHAVRPEKRSPLEIKTKTSPMFPAAPGAWRRWK